MSHQSPLVNLPVEAPLFAGGALALALEALLDPQDQTIVFVVRGFDVPAGKLIALWSSSPVGFESFSTAYARALHEFGDLLIEHTGPFS
jgi:hypothetical protein